jgi:WD40 repeat protein
VFTALTKSNSILNVDFSPDSRFLLIQGDGMQTAQIHDLSSAQSSSIELDDVGGTVSGFETARFSPDGRFVAAASRSRQVILYDFDPTVEEQPDRR